MCLAVIGKIVSVDGDRGEALIGGKVRQVSLVALPGLTKGEHVLVSLGMALERVTESEAKEIDGLWDEIAQIEPGPAAKEVNGD